MVRAPGSYASATKMTTTMEGDLPVVDASQLSALTETSSVSEALAVKGGAAKAAVPVENSLKKRLEIGTYFFLWYALNVGYNITNKKTLNAISFPWTLSVVQLVVGSLFVLPLWGLRLRKAPGLSMQNIKTLSPIALCHMLSHVCAVIGLGAGAISFVHIVKAGEPLFTALFSAVFLKQIFSPLVYATLIPVVAGVGIASLKELDFKWLALGGAMGSNIAASSRAILAKRSMGMDKGKNMDAANLYAVLTILASLMLLPLSAAVEGPRVKELWDAAILAGTTSKEIIYGSVSSGVFFYLYNEVAFRCLDVVHPVTHAVGNTFKRVFLIATSIIFFKTSLTPMSFFGSVLAIGGVLLYSLAKEASVKKASA
ncbi:unnamed protein product [Choristocarpus tenellus]